MNDKHPNEAIELYALGALERDEARAVEDHASGCDACARRLGEAERTVAALDAIAVPIFDVPAALGEKISASARNVRVLAPRTPPNFTRWATLAACVAVAGVGIGGARDIALKRATIASDDRAFAAIAASHFSHTTLTKAAPDAPTSKVLWGKDPHWVYVIVDAPVCGCDVVAFTVSGERDLGTPESRGDTSTLFVPDVPGVTRIELHAAGRIIAMAKHP